ncbi:MAG TPA: glycosyltransferase family 9 protein [Actinomycetota bacterium]|nr:glycosyltransferase family 9 protein [Actinomycetota bacterium]
MSQPVVLVLRALGLGDLLTALPAMRGLIRAFPGHRHVLAAPAALGPLAVHAGAAHGVLPVRGLEPLPRSVARPDLAVNLHGRGPRSHRLLLALRPRRLIGFAHGEVPGTAGAPAWPEEAHEVDRWCLLLAASGIPADPRDLRLSPPPVPAPEGAAGATILHPGAKAAARRWPRERWAAVARAERAAGRRVLVTGSAAEVDLARRVARAGGLPDRSVIAGRTDLLTLAAAVAAADRVVAGDTGVAHLATALATPSVLLFGPSPPSAWGPPPGAGPHVVLWKGGTGDPLADRPDPGLLAIEAEEVISALRSLDREPRPGGCRSRGRG